MDVGFGLVFVLVWVLAWDWVWVLVLTWVVALTGFQQRDAAFPVGGGDFRVLLVLELDGADRDAGEFQESTQIGQPSNFRGRRRGAVAGGPYVA